MRHNLCPHSTLYCWVNGCSSYGLWALGKQTFLTFESLVALSRKDLHGNILEVNCV